MTYQISIDNVRDIDKINKFATECDFNVYVSDSLRMVDAKSILGLMSIIKSKDLKLVFPDHVEAWKVDKAIKKLKMA